MHGRRIRWVAALSAASLVAQPFLVLPEAAAEAGAAQACLVPAVEASLSLHFIPATIGPVAFVPITALPTAAIETQRSAIAEIMIELGEDEDRARQMATELTAEDLAVLLANPKMMQKAGDVVIIILAVVLVCGIVALALAADSAVIITN